MLEGYAWLLRVRRVSCCVNTYLELLERCERKRVGLQCVAIGLACFWWVINLNEGFNPLLLLCLQGFAHFLNRKKHLN